MADENLKNIKISQQDVKEAFEQWVKEQSEQGYSAENIKYNIEQGQKQVNDILIKKAKAIALDKYYQQAVNKMGDALVKQVSSVKSQNTWDRITNFLAKDGGGNRDSFEQMYRVRQRFGGIEQMFSGNLLSGLSQFAGSFKNISRIMGGPYFLALQTVITALLKFDNALAKASTTASSITGGLQSQYIGKGLSSMAYNTNLKNDLFKIGMQGQRDELISALQKNYGYASYEGNQREFINTMAYGQKGLSAYGIEPGSTNQLISNLRLIEGKNQQGVYAQLQRLADRFNKMSAMSPEQALQQATSLYDQTKHLGTNFEWASKAIQRFEVGLKNGTISLNDFAAVNRALRGGGISKNAGIAAMVVDYASRSGINLPTSFMSSNILGQGFGISTRAMLQNSQFAKAYQGTIQEQLNQIGGSTKLEKAGALQYLLGQYGINISPEMAEKAIKSNGQIDLLGTNIIGTGIFQREKDEKIQAEKYQSLVESYYKGTTSWHTQTLAKLDKLISNTGSSFAEGWEGNLDPNATGLKAFGQYMGYAWSEGIWKQFGNIFKAIGEQALKNPPPLN